MMSAVKVSLSNRNEIPLPATSKHKDSYVQEMIVVIPISAELQEHVAMAQNGHGKILPS